MHKLFLLVLFLSGFNSYAFEPDKFYESDKVQKDAITKLISFYPELNKTDLVITKLQRTVNIQPKNNEPNDYIELTIYDVKNLIDAENSEWSSLIQQFGESFKVINEYTVRYSLDKSVKLNLNKSFHGVSNSTKPLLGQLLGQLSDKISSNKPIKQD